MAEASFTTRIFGVAAGLLAAPIDSLLASIDYFGYRRMATKATLGNLGYGRVRDYHRAVAEVRSDDTF
ncbi:hypothetical protein Ait01nite_018390 [Actinoplanes italicus]|nr:hypothetical protein Ait01nite_018390 [Actinoplanes italicus]